MTVVVRVALIASGLFLGVLLFLELGRRWGVRHLARDPDGARVGAGAVEGAVFGLLGLLIAFTFSGAASRYDIKRDLIVVETNAIGTAWLRLDVLPHEAQPALRELFRQYVDARLATYRRLPDLDAARADLDHTVELQNQIWTRSVAAAGSTPIAADDTVLLPALNEMFDIVTTRTAAFAYMHPPSAIYVMLFAMALIGALFAGAAMAGSRQRNGLYVIGFAAIIAASTYMILDLEYPRFGLIRVSASDQLMIDLRASFDR